MDNNSYIFKKVCDSMTIYMQSQSSNSKVNFLAGYPYECISPKDSKRSRIPATTALNLMASFIVHVAENNGPVNAAMNAAKQYIDQHDEFYEPTKNFEDVLFKAMYCLPAKYVPLIIKKGLDVNEKRAHPIYTELNAEKSYPMLAFAAYQGDSEKIKALFDVGADKSSGFVAAGLCVGSEIITAEQKMACLSELKMGGADFLSVNEYRYLIDRCQDERVYDWLEEEKEAYEARKIVAHQSKKINISSQKERV